MVSLSFQQPRRQRQGLAGWRETTDDSRGTTPEADPYPCTRTHTLADVWGSTLSGNSVAAATTLAWTERTNISTTERSSLVCEPTPVIEAEPPLSCSPISRGFHLRDFNAIMGLVPVRRT